VIQRLLTSFHRAAAEALRSLVASVNELAGKTGNRCPHHLQHAGTPIRGS